ncbi:MAG TPA: hypothetical protein PK106_00735 [Bacteroidales bacterium]|jgi:hypothetical protein|nr:hypothetical protein [Bacteroidales bacterium]
MSSFSTGIHRYRFRIRNLAGYAVKVLMAVLIVVQSSCKKEEFIWGQKVGAITYSGNVVFLGASELAILEQVTDNRLVFSRTTGEIDKITGTSILVIGISEKTPYGLLRKVTSLQKSGEVLTVNTEDALLQDAVKDGTITLNETLLEKNFVLRSKTPGVLINESSKFFEGLAITLDKLEVSSGGSAAAELNGSMGLGAEVEISIIIRSNRIERINLAATLNRIDELTIISGNSFSGSGEVTAAEFLHRPVIIDSLVFVPEVSMIAGFEGLVSGSVNSGVRQDRVSSLSTRYEAGFWSDQPVTNTVLYDYLRPSVPDNSDLMVFSGPRVTIRLFGIPLLETEASSVFSLEKDQGSSAIWRLYIGNNGEAKIRSEIFGFAGDHTLNMAAQLSEIGTEDSK